MRLQKHEMIAYYEQEKDKLQSVQSGLSQLLSDVGLENVNQGIIAIKHFMRVFGLGHFIKTQLYFFQITTNL